ncbi:iron ABC transporter permease [Candidatus Bipolaricaulota bacterium]|nr:iron ABC transporter permease [Candidatus Bipolaricaulota bacterium]
MAKAPWGGPVRKGAGACFALLPLLFLALSFFLPLWQVLSQGLKVEGRWTAARLAQLLSDPYVLHLLRFTLKQALLSCLLSLALGFPLGWLLARYDFPGKEALRAFTLVPFVLPPITVALGFILFFGNSGYLNRFLIGLFGLSSPPIKVLYSLWGIVLAHAFYNAPVFARFVSAAWEGLDPGLTEAARTLGARPFFVFLTVTLPQLLPAIVSAFCLVFVFCFLSFAIPLALGGAKYATVEVGVYLYARVFLDQERAAALAILELIIALGLAYLYIRGGGIFTSGGRVGRPQGAVKLFSRPRQLLWFPYLLLSALVFLGPIGAVIADSFARPWQGQAPTLAWYGMLFSSAQSPFIGGSPLTSIALSLKVAGTTAFFALGLGVLVCWSLRRVRSVLLEALLMAPLAVSSVVLGLALLFAFRRPPLSALAGGPWGIVLAHTLIVYPFVVRVIRPLWQGLDPALVEAARTLGAGRFLAFLTVELPLLSRGILVAGAFAFALSMGEMTAVAMLSRPGLVTVPLAIYHFLSARRFGAASAMATILILITAGAVFLWEYMGRRLLRGQP